MENYHVLEIIGEGSFGKVYKGRKKYSSQVSCIWLRTCITMIINHRVSFKYRDLDKFKIYYQMIIKKNFFISITGCCLEIYSKGWKTRKRAKKSEKRDRYYEKFTS